MACSGRLVFRLRWADACVYAVFLHNIIPNTFLGGERTPDGVVKGTRQRWDRLRVFGCDVYNVIANDQFKSTRVFRVVPRKMIFVSFDENRAGFKLFDPRTRTYHSAGDY